MPCYDPDELVGLRELARRVGRTWKTIYRWVDPGVQGVTLRVEYLGAVMQSCPRWVGEFSRKVGRRKQEKKARRRESVTAAYRRIKQKGLAG